MKLLTTLIGLFVGTAALAQQTEKPVYKQLSKSINDDGKTLAIDINGEQVTGQKLRYKRTFNVADLSAEQKEALTNHVLDSLGINDVPKPPSPPAPPQTSWQTVTFDCETCTDKGRLEVYGNNLTSTRTTDSRQDGDHSFPLKLDLIPGDYRLKYYQKSVLQIQSTFTVKEGEKTVVKVK